MTVILKKDDKVKAVIDALSYGYSFDNFLEKFKELYPKDWIKLENAYTKHLKDTKPGKKIPMPKPEQYLRNALNVWLKKN